MGNAISGRDERIRTSDLLVPNEALYQAEPHPDKMEPLTGIEPVTFPLPRGCSTSELQRLVSGGECRIRTYEGVRRQIYSLFPLATRATPQKRTHILPYWNLEKTSP